ncbi:MATE family efflux transporter [Candidatus Ozemobacteraceae bacterium]|nr:MATE family efflux transporter [Candidatus Ozemobacteraceae bacterium]
MQTQQTETEPSQAPTGPEKTGASVGRAAAGARGVDLTNGSIWKHLIAFSMPMLAGSLLQTSYNIINAVWVGKYLGNEALAAVTVCFPPLFLMMAMANGLGMAASVMAAQAYGAKDDAGVGVIVDTGVALTVALSVVCLVAGHEGAEPLLRLMGTAPDVLPLAVPYLRLLSFTVPVMFGLFLLTALLRGVGDSKTPLWFQTGSVVATIVLDPVLIFGLAGAPRMGLNGTAVATLATQIGALIALGLYLRARRHIAMPGRGLLTPNIAVGWRLLKIGVPSMIQQGLVSFGMVVLVSLVNGFGRDVTAAFGAGMRIDQLAFMPAMSIGTAVSSIAGQNIGARLFDRVDQAFRAGVAMCLVSGGLAALIAFFLPDLVMRAFLSDQASIDIGCEYLRITSIGYLLFSVMFVSNGVINGAGDTMATTFFSLLGLWIIRLPLALALSQAWHHQSGIWWAVVVSFGVAMSVSVLYYRSGRWKRGLKHGMSATQPGMDGTG